MPDTLHHRPTTRRPGRRPGAARAWTVVAGLAVTLAALVSALPPARSVFGAAPAAGLSAQLDRAVLMAASVVTWLLALWLAGVLLVALAARLVLGGRRGQLVVTRLAQLLVPRALRGVVITAVGVGSMAAMAGCAPASTATPAGASGDQATSTAAAPTLGAPLTVDLDWPLDTPPPPADPPPPFVTTTPASAPAGDSAEPESAAGSSDVETAPPSAAPPTTFTPVGATPPVATGAPTTSTPVPAPAPTPATSPGASSAEPVPPPAATAAATAAAPTTEPTAEPGLPTPPPAAGSGDPTAPTDPAAADVVTGADVPAATGEAPAPGVVTVVRGDSLWSLAATHLPTGASAADIADAWPHWYAANRDVIGDDPDHIEPGWQLAVPTEREDSRP